DRAWSRSDRSTASRAETRRFATDDQSSDVLAGLEAGFSSDDPARSPVAVVLGHAAKVTVHYGHLVAEDGVGWYRRRRPWNRANKRLRRLIIGADSGYLSIDSLVWCQSAGVAVIVVDSDCEVMLGPGRYGADDARLRRVQAAPPEALAVEAATMLLGAKLAGQASLARDVLDRADVAGTIGGLPPAQPAAGRLAGLRPVP